MDAKNNHNTTNRIKIDKNMIYGLLMLYNTELTVEISFLSAERRITFLKMHMEIMQMDIAELRNSRLNEVRLLMFPNSISVKIICAEKSKTAEIIFSDTDIS